APEGHGALEGGGAVVPGRAPAGSGRARAGGDGAGVRRVKVAVVGFGALFCLAMVPPLLFAGGAGATAAGQPARSGSPANTRAPGTTRRWATARTGRWAW